MRLKGWENPYPREGRAMPENIPWFVIHKCYEAGADAYEEGLKKQGIEIDANQNPVGKTMAELMAFLDACKKGYLVFIEEAVEVDGEIVNVGDDRPPTVTTKRQDGNSH